MSITEGFLIWIWFVTFIMGCFVAAESHNSGVYLGSVVGFSIVPLIVFAFGYWVCYYQLT